VTATAAVLFQRFYCKRSFAQFNVKARPSRKPQLTRKRLMTRSCAYAPALQRMAAAAVFLGAKLEEQQRRSRDVINVFHRLEKRHALQAAAMPSSSDAADAPAPAPSAPAAPALLDPFSRRYDELKAELIRCERLMLREFGFVAHVEHPHKFVLNYCQVMDLPAPLMQAAWGAANDSLRSTLCVRFPAEAVACGAIHFAARRLGVPMPEEAPAWWGVFGVTSAQVEEVAAVVAALHAQPRAQYIEVGPPPAGSTPPPRQAAPPQQPGQQGPGPQAAPRQVVLVPNAAAAAAHAAAAAVAARLAAAGAAAAQGAQQRAPERAPERGGDRDRGRRERSRSRDRDRRRERDRSRSRERERDRSRDRRRRSRSRSRERRR
jgi:hypothetical protein